MPLNDYEGDTFVAFLDISGFKELMQNANEAWRALDRLYNNGYSALQALRQYTQEYLIDGLFISDCGVLFIRRDEQSILGCFKSLLNVVRNINRMMRNENFMLTTSIAYGKFKYQQRIEFEGIEKNPVFGNAYLSAYLDNEAGSPRIQPGQCRILKQNLPEVVKSSIESHNNDEILKMIRERIRDKHHYYYYWMRACQDEINEFEQIYTDSYKLKFEGMLRALKGNQE